MADKIELEELLQLRSVFLYSAGADGELLLDRLIRLCDLTTDRAMPILFQ